MNNELLPCPFCGGSDTRIDEQTHWTGMRSQIVSVSVKHWCQKNPLQPFIEMKAMTREKAIDLWNTRADKAVPEWQPIETAPMDGSKFLAFNDELGFTGSDGREQGSRYQICWYGYNYITGKSGFRALFSLDFIEQNTFTHWMPLPQPPTGD